MTADEMLAREAIRQTMAAYNIAGDRLRGDDFAAVFTEDAVLESQGAPPESSFRYEGRSGIHAWISGWRDPPTKATATPRASFVRHHLSTCHIELVDKEAARARTYWSAWTDIGPDHAGHYLDDFRRVDGAWLIHHRRVRLDWQAEGSLFRAAIMNAAGESRG